MSRRPGRQNDDQDTVHAIRSIPILATVEAMAAALLERETLQREEER